MISKKVIKVRQKQIYHVITVYLHRQIYSSSVIWSSQIFSLAALYFADIIFIKFRVQ